MMKIQVQVPTFLDFMSTVPLGEGIYKKLKAAVEELGNHEGDTTQAIANVIYQAYQLAVYKKAEVDSIVYGMMEAANKTMQPHPTEAPQIDSPQNPEQLELDFGNQVDQPHP